MTEPTRSEGGYYTDQDIARLLGISGDACQAGLIHPSGHISANKTFVSLGKPGHLVGAGAHTTPTTACMCSTSPIICECAPSGPLSRCWRKMCTHYSRMCARALSVIRDCEPATCVVSRPRADIIAPLHLRATDAIR